MEQESKSKAAILNLMKSVAYLRQAVVELEANSAKHVESTPTAFGDYIKASAIALDEAIRVFDGSQ